MVLRKTERGRANIRVKTDVLIVLRGSFLQLMLSCYGLNVVAEESVSLVGRALELYRGINTKLAQNSGDFLLWCFLHSVVRSNRGSKLCRGYMPIGNVIPMLGQYYYQLFDSSEKPLTFYFHKMLCIVVT